MAAAKQHPSYYRPFTTTSSTQASTKTQRRRHQDPYAIAQAKARKAANKSRQEVLKKERASTLGDPVRGITTDYLRSFDTVSDQQPPDLQADNIDNIDPFSTEDEPPVEKGDRLNFYLNKNELQRGIKYSQWISTPSIQSVETDHRTWTDEKTPEQREAERQAEQETASEALRRISSLSIGNSKDRLRVNIQRCISDFGRHSTDAFLPPKPPSIQSPPGDQLPKTPRVGPDTGSSEVQIAILTAKIRTLADFLETRGRMDKANKRNLRLLVHRRAKLLKYLRRKERGGPRFQNVVKTLGLTDGTWKGEITIMGPLGGHSPVRLAKLQGRTMEA